MQVKLILLTSTGRKYERTLFSFQSNLYSIIRTAVVGWKGSWLAEQAVIRHILIRLLKAFRKVSMKWKPYRCDKAYFGVVAVVTVVPTEVDVKVDFSLTLEKGEVGEEVTVPGRGVGVASVLTGVKGVCTKPSPQPKFTDCRDGRVGRENLPTGTADMRFTLTLFWGNFPPPPMLLLLLVVALLLAFCDNRDE